MPKKKTEGSESKYRDETSKHFMLAYRKSDFRFNRSYLPPLQNQDYKKEFFFLHIMVKLVKSE